tara:strand:- start:272 stop:745 length:474 start_codon:yes stop_codon:yes gene_type:complete
MVSGLSSFYFIKSDSNLYCYYKSNKLLYLTTVKRVINTKKAPTAIGPYSQAVFANNTLYVSGQIAIIPDTGDIDLSSIKSETEQIMKNLQAVLESVDMTFSNVVKCTIFLKCMSFYDEVNKVYSKYFQIDPPAREAVAVSTLPKNVNVEISLIAVKL